MCASFLLIEGRSSVSIFFSFVVASPEASCDASNSSLDLFRLAGSVESVGEARSGLTLADAGPGVLATSVPEEEVDGGGREKREAKAGELMLSPRDKGGALSDN